MARLQDSSQEHWILTLAMVLLTNLGTYLMTRSLQNSRETDLIARQNQIQIVHLKSQIDALVTTIKTVEAIPRPPQWVIDWMRRTEADIERIRDQHPRLTVDPPRYPVPTP
jgi:hypothetical protein